jgi:hypothetical protein
MLSEALVPTPPYVIEVPRFSSCEETNKTAPINPAGIAQLWTKDFNAILDLRDASKLTTLFHQDCWWRDQLALSWDFRTIRSLPTVIEYVQGNLARSQLGNVTLRTDGAFAPSVKQPLDGLEWVQSMFDFETKTGAGSGVIRLIQGSDGAWKAYAISTMLQELKDHREQIGHLRPHGGDNSLLGGSMKGNWSERRQRQAEFVDEEPTVLIIGAGKLDICV